MRNKKIELKLKEKARINTAFIEVKYAGGDADTEHFQEYLLKDVTVDNWVGHENIEKEIKLYEIIKTFNNNYDITYDEILEKYGQEVVDVYEEIPGDPQVDYQFNCSFQSLKLIIYDALGDKYEAYLIY